MIKPNKLNKGATLGIIAPSGPVYDKNRITKGIEILKSLGFKVVISNNCYLKHGYLAGEDSIRAADINRSFENKYLDGIICLRGGYGALRILDLIDYNIINKNPKAFIGYSDITALHSAIHKNCNLVTFHGPMVASDIADDDFWSNEALINSISGNIYSYNIKLNPIKGGNVKGELVGGNLSVICSLIGSNFLEDYENKLLFIEDIGEEPYRIDRMLQQLKLSGIINKLKGVILGQFTNCQARDEENSLSLDYVINDFFAKMAIPVYCNLQAGHENKKITLPLGIEVEILNNILSFKEEGVV
jgi:muramoyltetrapeptide carboxypeptidase